MAFKLSSELVDAAKGIGMFSRADIPISQIFPYLAHPTWVRSKGCLLPMDAAVRKVALFYLFGNLRIYAYFQLPEVLLRLSSFGYPKVLLMDLINMRNHRSAAAFIYTRGFG
jgi:hypothetical protein